MPRKDLTIAKKIVLLKRIKEQPPNTSHRQLAEITGVPRTTLARILQDRDKLEVEWSSHKEAEQGNSHSKRKRKGKNPDIEEAVGKWFSVVTRRGVSVSGPMLKSKSEEFAKKLGHIDFKATDGWLSRWKTRSSIKFKKALGEKASADFANSKLQWKLRLPSLLQKFRPEDIYNADKTGLFYRATPNGSMVYKYKALSGSKKAMDRVTVLCCSNMLGTDKRKLLVIGKSVKPRYFKGLRIDSLPVQYHANKNAWMTSVLFEKWLTDWDRELKLKSRNIFLILDNCAAHPNLDCLTNVQLQFLPPNTTALAQPMDMGIIKSLKSMYRGKLVRHILVEIEDNMLTSSATAQEISSAVNLLQAVQFIADSWRAVSPKTIQNSFRHCGFEQPELELDAHDNEDQGVSEVQCVENYEQFDSIDDTVSCYNENDHCEDDILEQIAEERQNTMHTAEDEDDMPEFRHVTNREAKKYIDELRIYFMQESNEGSPITALTACSDFVEMQAVKKSRQSRLDKYFH